MLLLSISGEIFYRIVYVFAVVGYPCRCDVLFLFLVLI